MLDGTQDPVRRYAPPSQRNRIHNRRKSGDKFEKINSYGIEGEKGQSSYSRNFSAMDHGEAVSNNIENENTRLRLIPIDGCCTSEAVQLLNDRWAAAMHSFNDPSIDLSERPIMYSGASGSSWGHLKLPLQMDFLGELRRAMQAAQINAVPSAGDRS
ncbi:uncharacterized protein M6B38_196385 [Iris pallida]|uniref:Uncharacterized protein n=1 Tax=Iris pallida TaxID=29817 RepID=A0AAX6DML8_IRIPA|nr:Uncharacterized protein M6B38_112295 [Iris pallida]KAJ6801841.1 uncharacterized protein M6B38_196385 [Iris pallida]